jgi:predicted nucleotidyltransferase
MAEKDKELSKIVNIIVKNVFPQKIFLFGSRAMDNASKKSDYDLFVLVKNE